jgi:hypothetical protein
MSIVPGLGRELRVRSILEHYLGVNVSLNSHVQKQKAIA